MEKDFRLVDITGLLSLIENSQYKEYQSDRTRLKYGTEYEIAKFLLSAENVKEQKKIVRYKLLEGTVDDIVDCVIGMQSEGYFPQGGISKSGDTYLQTMVKYE